MKTRLITAFIILFTISQSCKKDTPQLTEKEEVFYALPTLPATPFNYVNQAVPSYIKPFTLESDNTPDDNPVTDHGATLGRVLFYEKNLSINNSISCGSCHVQKFAFSDTNTLSNGFDGGLTARHSMSLTYAKYYQPGHFFWDTRAATLEDQVLMPVEDPVEMGMTVTKVIERLGEIPFYEQLFVNAFGDSKITELRIRKALAQFIRSINTYDSKFDEGMRLTGNANLNFPNFSPIENNGKRLFLGRAGCVPCHGSNLQIAIEPENNGLDSIITDNGLYDVTLRDSDRGRFKVGSLRNIALTAPYMHDGRFKTLLEVVEHYNSKVKKSPTLSTILRDQNGEPIRLNLNELEKQSIVLFLKTLTDSSSLRHEKFSDPFMD